MLDHWIKLAVFWRLLCQQICTGRLAIKIVQHITENGSLDQYNIFEIIKLIELIKLIL